VTSKEKALESANPSMGELERVEEKWIPFSARNPL
jgi:hypothetical protein